MTSPHSRSARGVDAGYGCVAVVDANGFTATKTIHPLAVAGATATPIHGDPACKPGIGNSRGAEPVGNVRGLNMDRFATAALCLLADVLVATKP